MTLSLRSLPIGKLQIFLMLFFLSCYLWKVSGLFWVDGLSDHLSNFGLTGFGILLFAGPAFTRGGAVWWVAAVTGFFVIANIVVEGMAFGTLHGFNVVDSDDAVFGIAAAFIVLIAFLFVNRIGVRQ